MSRDLEESLRRRLASYVAGKSTLRKFVRWFTPATWNLDAKESDALKEIAYGTSHLLAEFSNGDWTEPELKERLWLLLNSHHIAETEDFRVRAIVTPSGKAESSQTCIFMTEVQPNKPTPPQTQLSLSPSEAVRLFQPGFQPALV